MYRENRGRGFNRPPREMHKVTCADCGKETEVPFKPDGTRPVYCRDCYQSHKPKRFQVKKLNIHKNQIFFTKNLSHYFLMQNYLSIKLTCRNDNQIKELEFYLFQNRVMDCIRILFFYQEKDT